MGAIVQRILVKWRTLAVAILAIKLAIVFMSTPSGDFINWAGVASVALGLVSRGRIPPVSVAGVYTYMGVVLTPFFWFWTLLPINHPSLTYANYLGSYSTPAFFLNVFLKTPLFIADMGAGLLVMKLVGTMTGSETKDRLAFLAWFANPFNIYWINIDGAVDVIPTTIVLLAIYLALKDRTFLSGFSLAVGGILRIFPFLTFPFLLCSPRGRNFRSITYLLLGFLLVPIVGLTALYITKAGSLEAVALIPSGSYGGGGQPWLLDFLGSSSFNFDKYAPPVAGPDVKSAVVVLVLQLLVCVRFWKNPQGIHLVTASIFALFIGSLAYAGDPRHFMWVSPLLTVSLAINPNEVWVFLLTFASAFGVTYPFTQSTPLLGTFLGGIFVGAEAIYLLKINQENIQVNAVDSRPVSLRT